MEAMKNQATYETNMYKRHSPCYISSNRKKKDYLKKQGTSNIIVKCSKYLICIQDSALKNAK